MTPLYEKVASSEVLLFASPIYWFTVCGQTKQCIDRLFALAVQRRPDGSNPLADKKIGGIFTYEDEDPVKSGCVNAIRSFQDICSHTGAVWLGAVYGSAYAEGEVAGNVQLLAKAREYGTSI